MRLKLVPSTTKIDFFRRTSITSGLSALLVLGSILSMLVFGFNFGVDFRGGTSIRTESTQAVDVGAYRDAIAPLGLGDVTITEVFDPSFRADQHVASLRIQAQGEEQSASLETIAKVEAALVALDPAVKFVLVESVGPKVSRELVRSAALSVLAGALAILIYIWLRFEWQFAVGAVAALVHDVTITAGIFSLFQLKFDLTIIAALLTILGYSINDTVVIFDRVRENLRRYKVLALKDLLNLSLNETLSRTLVTSFTVLIALVSLLVFGGDVIRGFVVAMIFGVLVGSYSTIYVASDLLLRLGVKRDWSKPDGEAGTQFANLDA